MKNLMRRVDRFCLTHPRFGIKNLMLYLVIGTGVVALFAIMDRSDTLISLLAFDASAIFTRGQIWRLFTFVLMPDQLNFWLLIELYFYYWIGSVLERQWGPGKFTIYYLSGMLFNVLYGTVVWLLGADVSINAMFLNLSMFFAFATLFPDTMVLLLFFIPMKVKWLAYFDAAFFVIEMIVLPFPYNLLPLIAVLNYFIFCGGWLFDKFRPARIQQRQKTINYKKAARKYNREQAKKPYNHKCEVCGRTDADYPDLEFRYCSKCVGYHCFCIDHINNHVHFKE